MKHTLGPWHRHDLHIHAQWESDTGVRHYAVVDALEHGGMATGEADANARLIAAAPELLEALKAVTEFFNPKPGQRVVIDCIVKALYVIQKATGEHGE